MLMFKLIRNTTGDISHIETSLSSSDLLGNPKLNKGCAFSREERELFNLHGLLPHQIETLDQQVARMYAQYQEFTRPLSKNIYLNALHDYNETLFYKLVSQHLEEMMPIVYTPTVGEAVKNFSLEHRKSRGIYLSYPERNSMDNMLDNSLCDEIDLIVVTDGEAILGIGDQGIGGINISVAKLMVYTLCGKINPHRVLPIQLDVGTNNQHLLSDPMYLGWRHERIHGEIYDSFIEQFVTAVTKKFGSVLLHWEDFGRDNARRILNHYRDKICTFNGDIQGTGSVALASVLAGCIANQLPLKDQRIVIFGAGTAGVGIADHIVSGLLRDNLSEKEAYSRLWLIDKTGLLTDKTQSLLPFQKPYQHSSQELSHWQLRDSNSITLYDVVKNIRPTILIGTSAVPGAFSEKIIRLMADQVEKPIIMPLSNPTTQAEATPEDLLHWTNGRAVIATGSPFQDVTFAGQSIRISQSNNALAFPGIGLGTIAVKAKYLTDDMLWAATQALAHCSPVNRDSNAPLLPKLSEINFVSHSIALAVAEEARRSGLARIDKHMDLNEAIKRVSWEPRYYPYRKINSPFEKGS